MAEIRPFRVQVHDAAIDDLRERLARTRWPEKEPVGDWSMGIPLAYVQELEVRRTGRREPSQPTPSARQ